MHMCLVLPFQALVARKKRKAGAAVALSEAPDGAAVDAISQPGSLEKRRIQIQQITGIPAQHEQPAVKSFCGLLYALRYSQATKLPLIHPGSICF